MRPSTNNTMQLVSPKESAYIMFLCFGQDTDIRHDGAAMGLRTPASIMMIILMPIWCRVSLARPNMIWKALTLVNDRKPAWQNGNGHLVKRRSELNRRSGGPVTIVSKGGIASTGVWYYYPAYRTLTNLLTDSGIHNTKCFATVALGHHVSSTCAHLSCSSFYVYRSHCCSRFVSINAIA